MRHVEKEEEKFRTRDHILDTEIGLLIIALADDNDSDVQYILKKIVAYQMNTNFNCIKSMH